MKQWQKYVLSNGLRVLLVPQKGITTATVLVLVEAGSKYEVKKLNGISHFLEHLCFKGTKKRPTSFDVVSELETLGSSHNAFTGHEVTGYHSKVAAPKISAALEIISDLYLNPVFDSAELEKEKGVVIEELNMFEDMPMRLVPEYFTELLYADQPAGWRVGGTKTTIPSFTREDVIRYRSAHYVAEGTVVVVAGNVKPQQILKEIKQLFKTIPITKKTDKLPVQESQKDPQVRLIKKDSDQTHIALGFRAFSMFDERRYALSILMDVLGGGMSSRLFQKVRSAMGVAYYIEADASLLTDHGFWTVSAGIDNHKLIPALEAIMQEFRKLKLASITRSELERAKKHLSGQLLTGLETSEALASFYGQQEIFKEKILASETIIKHLKAVTLDQVTQVAKDTIRNEGLNLAMIGPLTDLPKDFQFK